MRHTYTTKKLHFAYLKVKPNWAACILSGNFSKDTFNFLAAPCGLQDFSSLLGSKPTPPAEEVQSLNQWTASEVPVRGTFIT